MKIESIENLGMRRHWGTSSNLDKPGGLHNSIKGFKLGQSSLGLSTAIMHKINLFHQEVYSFEKNLNSLEDISYEHFHFPLQTMQILNFRGIKTSISNPKIYHFHGPWALESQQNPDEKWLRNLVKNVIEKKVLSQFDSIWCASEAFKSLLCNHHEIDENKVFVTPLGVDLERFQLSAERTESYNFVKPFKIVSVRRLVPRMGLETLIRAVSLIDNVELEIGGVGALRDDLHKLARELKIDHRVKMVGYVSDLEMNNFLGKADLCVIPSASLEGFCIAALEAFACGVPVIASNLDGLKTTVGGLSSKLLFEPRNVESLRDAILGFMNSPAVTSQECRKYAETFSWTKSATALEHELKYRLK